MLSHEEIERAKKRASIRAPEPTVSPLDAAGKVALIIGFSLACFIGLAGLDEETIGIPVLIVLVIGVGGTYLHFRNEENKHFKACCEEEEQIRSKKKYNKEA